MVDYTDSIYVMGTFLEVSLFGEDRSVLRDLTREVFHQARLLERQMSIHLAESEVSFVNTYASRRAVRVEKGLFDLIGAAVAYSDMTEGAFDITVGTLRHPLTGSGRESRSGATMRDRPLPVASRQRLKLNMKRQSVRFTKPGVRIDLGGIAKGYAVDQIVDLLRRRRVTSAFVNFGSSSAYGLGTPPGRRFWRVPLMNPVNQGKQVAEVRLVNQSLSSSGNYLSGRESLTENFHVLDPATGRPNRVVLGAAVVAPSAIESEAFSTAVCVMGLPRAGDLVCGRENVNALIFERCNQPTGAQVVEVRDGNSSPSPFRIRRLSQVE